MRSIATICGALLALIAIALSTGVSFAQGTDAAPSSQDDAEKSSFVLYVEEQLSSENFQIKLNGLEGVLSSEVALSSITIADRSGIWLTIDNPKLLWNRSALLGGRIEIESLTAKSIEIDRMPLPDERLPSAEASSFSLPDLPLAIILDKLSLGRVSVAESVFGLKSVVSVEGRIKFSDGELDVDLNARRLDGPGGNLRAVAKFDTETENLLLDLALSEPQNGVVASLLDIPDRPPVSLAINGNSPLDNLSVNLAFDAAAKRILDGSLTLKATAGGQRMIASLNGPLSEILPVQHRSFFGSNSALSASIVFADDGSLTVESASVKGGQLSLQASGQTATDAFPTKFDLRLLVEPKPGTTQTVVLPVGGGDTTVERVDLSARYDAGRGDSWQIALSARGVSADDANIDSVALNAGGVISQPSDPSQRSVTFDLEGSVLGIAGPDAAPSVAGERISIDGEGSWRAGNPVKLQLFNIRSDTFELALQGLIDNTTFDGNVSLKVDRLVAFSGLADGTLGGQAEVNAQGTYSPLSGSFDLTVNGTTRDIAIGQPVLDPLLAGETLLTGKASRTAAGLAFNRLRVANRQAEILLDGTLASQRANLTANARIVDLAMISEQASGPLTFQASVSGEAPELDVSSELQMPSGRLQGRAVKDFAARFVGQMRPQSGPRPSSLQGDFTANGSINSEPITLSSSLKIEGQSAALERLTADIAGTTLNGALKRNGSNGMLEGRLAVESADISDAAALILQTASGQVAGTIDLFSTSDMQSAKAALTAANFQYAGTRIGSAKGQATIVDLFGVPRVGGQMNAQRLLVSGQEIRLLQAQIGTQDATSEFDIVIEQDRFNTRALAKGSLTRTDGTTRISLDTLSVRSSLPDAALVSPAVVTMKGGEVQTDGFQLSIGSGTVSVSGTAGEQLRMNVQLTALPASIANLFQPDLDASGSLSGQVQIAGRVDNPQADFQFEGTALQARALTESGLLPIAVTANGKVNANTLMLTSASARNDQSLSITASGQIALASQTLDLRLQGSAPLALAEPFLAERGGRATGSATFDLNVRGSPNNPNASGLISISDGTLTDPLSNLKLSNIGLLAGVEGDRITINRSQASLSGGGTVSVSGTVRATADLPADLSLKLDQARYTDGETFTTRASGTLAITGNLANAARLSGQIDLGKTEIIVPESFATNAVLLEVTHVAPDSGTKATLNRLRITTPTSRGTSRSGGANLDLVVNAPSQIFVRGRGIDAELGGSIRVTGPVSDVRPIGRFNLRRGRLDILGRRIDLSEGSITLAGDLDPVLDLKATITVDSVDASIKLTGRASKLDVSFSSSPELPEDEVLALIIFGRNLNELSPVQITRLVSIAAELTGGGRPGLIGSIRSSTALDDLDVVQDAEGNTAVKAGKYLNDNVYLGVKAGQKTEATINLDITDEITARGTVGSDGSSSIGLFLEKDY